MKLTGDPRRWTPQRNIGVKVLGQGLGVLLTYGERQLLSKSVAMMQ